VANTKVTDLPVASSLVASDVLYVVTDPAGTPASEQSTVTVLQTLLNASPTFTGTPAAPTAAVGTNTTQVATTAFVNTAFLRNASVTSVATAYATDTYLAGSSIVIPAGIWTAKSVYRCVFDMVKTAAGTQAFTINVRLGTLGTTGDTSIVSTAFGNGTAAVDTGQFEVTVIFRTVGSGSSAVVQAISTCTHSLAVTGLTNTGAAGFGLIKATSSGFDSTTQTTIGISINGGTSFSGTNTQVQATLQLG